MKILHAPIFLLLGINSIAQTPQIQSLKSANTDIERAESNEELRVEMRSSIDGLIDFDELDEFTSTWPFGVAKAGEGEETVVVITWNYETSTRVQVYSGFVIFKNEGELIWIELVHDSRESLTDESRSYRSDDWTGCIYYDMVVTHNNTTPVYTILGWDGADGKVTRKVIETFIISNGTLRIGVPFIEVEKGLKKRHVLEYADILQVTLGFDSNRERIVFDHLAPNDPTLKGQTEFYGPTLEYDAYLWEDGVWKAHFDVELKNETENGRKKPYIDPKPDSPINISIKRK
jgi:hypothetical protein